MTTPEALLRRMVEIPSPSGVEQELALRLASWLTAWGYRSHVDEVGNVIGRRGDPAAPMIMLLGHMDTVPEQIPVRQVGPLLYGRGTVDAKGPLATMICAGAEVDVGDAQIVVAGAVDEEEDGRGARHLRTTYTPDVAIVGEPSGWSSVCIGYKGRFRLSYLVSRPASHTASPAEKATEVAVRFWNQLSEHLAAHPAGRRSFDRPTATLCEFRGTIAEASLAVTCRLPPGFDHDLFERFLERARGVDTLTIDDRTPAALIDRDTAAVRALCAAIRARGARPSLKVKSGTSDLNVVSGSWRIPMAVYGPGDSSLDHTAEEHVDLRELRTAIAVLRDALGRLVEDLRREPAQPAPAR